MIAVMARDAAGDGPAAARKALLAAHLAHVEAVLERIFVAGPLLGPDGTVTGSLLVLDVADVAAARALMARDPYSESGIWERVDYHDFKGVAGTWVGGKTW
jgi:uncharacterized protein YciI